MAPPVGKGFKIRCCVADLPIDLWADVVDPAVFDPCQRIGIGRGVVLKSMRIAAGKCVDALVAPNTGRADAKSAARLHRVLMDSRVYRLYELIHIVAPPVCQRQITAGCLISGCVVKIGRRIKIIVKLYAVHSVFADNFRYAVTDQLPHFCDAGIEIIPAVTGDDPIRMLLGRRRVRQRIKIALCVGTGTDAVWIHPGFQSEIAGVSLLYPIREWVEGIRWRCAARAGQISAPGEDRGAVQGIARRPDLKIDGVRAARCDAVEQGVALAAQGISVCCGLRWIINRICRCHPDTARLCLGGQRDGLRGWSRLRRFLRLRGSEGRAAQSGEKRKGGNFCGIAHNAAGEDKKECSQHTQLFHGQSSVSDSSYADRLCDMHRM